MRAVGVCAVGGVLVVLALLLGMQVSGAAQPPPPDESGVAPGAQVPDPRPDDAFADPQVAALQRQAAAVQTELAGLQDRVRSVQSELDRARAELATAQQARARADVAVAAQQREVDRYVSAVFTGFGPPSSLRALLAASDTGDVLDGLELISVLRADTDRRFAAALADQREAVRAEQAAAAAERIVAARDAELAGAVGDAKDRAVGLSAELNTALAATNAAVVAMQEEQRRRNEETAANWRRYTDQLAGAGIVPPPAAALRDPLRLPAGLGPLASAGGLPLPGVAQATGPDGALLLVLPAETIRAVTLAISTLGLPFTPSTGAGSTGPLAYSCDGLVHSVFEQAGLATPAAAAEQMATGIPVDLADVQPGDLVFFGPAQRGVQHVGIALDPHTVLAADARATSVAVTGFDPPTVLGVSRPSLGARPAAAVPQRTAAGPIHRCNGVQLRSGSAAGAWGGFPNGLIPTSALCPIGFGSHRLRCDAAQAYQAMSAAFASSFGRPLCVTDSYRTFPEQISLYSRRPALAAVPGTSNHGWGLALDLCGGVESFGTPQWAWMAANASSFGWVHPPWAAPGRGREEPWHWEYAG
ncbi:MAG: D-alanyl-D-alanine carboxypeptidase family protein [Actinomycetota bacterium]|nr:D-alanyl-D-alanine carboxypeptidase family protein [Actinomycetota bacterium]